MAATGRPQTWCWPARAAAACGGEHRQPRQYAALRRRVAPAVRQRLVAWAHFADHTSRLTKFRDNQAAHDTVGGIHATAVADTVHELDGPDEELQRRADGPDEKQLLALTVAASWTLQGSSDSY